MRTPSRIIVRSDSRTSLLDDWRAMQKSLILLSPNVRGYWLSSWNIYRRELRLLTASVVAHNQQETREWSELHVVLTNENKRFQPPNIFELSDQSVQLSDDIDGINTTCKHACIHRPKLTTSLRKEQTTAKEKRISTDKRIHPPKAWDGLSLWTSPLNLWRQSGKPVAKWVVTDRRPMALVASCVRALRTACLQQVIGRLHCDWRQKKSGALGGGSDVFTTRKSFTGRGHDIKTLERTGLYLWNVFAPF